MARCQILRLKCTKLDFRWAPPQTSLGELTALPDPQPLTVFKGAYLRGGYSSRRGGKGE